MKGYEIIFSAFFVVNFCKWINIVEIIIFIYKLYKKNNVDSFFIWLLIY